MQADIKTVTAHGMYAMSVITALTAQNTTGVYGILDTPPGFVAEQMDAVFTDIRPDAVKIGMVSNADTAEVIADSLEKYESENIVLDPVMTATSGGKLMKDETTGILVKRLMPLASVITPNIPEAEALSGGHGIRSRADMEAAAAAMADIIAAAAGRSPAILLKGGHLQAAADDLLYLPDADGRCVWFTADRIDNPNTHGTGCTLSSAIACGLADDPDDLEGAVRAAKQYVHDAIEAGLDIGRGRGPLNHMARWA